MINSEQCSTSLDSEWNIIGKYDKTKRVWAKSSALGEQKSCWFSLVSGSGRPFQGESQGILFENTAVLALALSQTASADVIQSDTLLG